MTATLLGHFKAILKIESIKQNIINQLSCNKPVQICDN